MSLLKALWLEEREKRKMAYKVHCRTFFRDLCNTIDKTDKTFFYLLLFRKSNRRTREFKQAVSNNMLKKYILRLKKFGFICNEYRESDSNAYTCGGLVRCCEEGARPKLLDRMNVFLQDSATKLHETAIRFYMKIEYEVHDFFAADIYYNNSCYIKFALKKIEQTVDETVELLENGVLEELFWS